jgi:cellulose synthase operon protein YhjQ
MDTRLTNDSEDPQVAETPEDVAILYSWANLHGAKYRDFSASRREYRAQVRHRAAEELRQAELRAQAEAEHAAAQAEWAAREAESAARGVEGYEAPAGREEAIREAEEAARRASAERVEAARRAEAAALAEAAARREEREIAEAHVSAQRQAARYAESEIRRRSLAGPQPAPLVPGLASDPYTMPQGAGPEVDLYSPNNQLGYTEPARFVADDASGNAPGERRPIRLQESGTRRRPQGFRPDEASGIRPAYRSESASPLAPVTPFSPQPISTTDEFASQSSPLGMGKGKYEARETPEWLTSQTGSETAGGSSVADTLQHSRERVAARWFALKGVFEPGEEPVAEPLAEPRQKETRTPVLAVFSLAGGVGKTSLVATLGRALSWLGEKVLLTDTTSHGLLPFYFGASELRPGVVRTFSPPSGSTDAPIHLVSYDVDQRGADRASQDALAEEMGRAATGSHRVLLDLNSSSAWLIRKLSRMSPTVLVPVAPDMNSVISLQAVERFFHGLNDQEGRAIQPFYVLNQFDASLPLHLDVREVLRRQLGDRLLPSVIRRSPVVSEALAEGMTVVDYAPDAAVAEDYVNIANWLRSVSAPATQGFRNIRWSER